MPLVPCQSAQNPPPCSDLLLLKPEGFKCACPTGVALKPDGKNCDNGESTLYMLLSNSYRCSFKLVIHTNNVTTRKRKDKFYSQVYNLEHIEICLFLHVLPEKTISLPRRKEKLSPLCCMYAIKVFGKRRRPATLAARVGMRSKRKENKSLHSLSWAWRNK